MARRRKSTDDPSKIEELPMTPMIDIIFQLLIFFMCSMHFKTLEGKLLSYLPKDKGLNPTVVQKPELEEIRIIMDWDGDAKKGSTRVSIERNPVGSVSFNRAMGSDEDKKSPVWTSLAVKIGGFYQAAKARYKKDVPVVIDAKKHVPWAHVMRALDACKQHKIDRVEFVGSPEHEPDLKNR